MNDGFKLAIKLKTDLQEMEKAVEDLKVEVEQLKRQRRDRPAFSYPAHAYRSNVG